MKNKPIIQLISHDGELVYVVFFPDGSSRFAWEGRKQAEHMVKQWLEAKQIVGELV